MRRALAAALIPVAAIRRNARASLLLAPLLVATCGKPEDAPPMGSFLMGFWAEKDGQCLSIEDRAALDSGTKLGMALETDGSCEVYVILRDSRGDVTVLHPPPEKQARATGTFEPVPDGTKLDAQKGVETFHVVAAREPLVSLSAAVEAFRSATPASREAAKAALLAELQATRLRHESVDMPAPRPALLAGRLVRGERPTFEFDVASVHCRTFTIDHR